MLYTATELDLSTFASFIDTYRVPAHLLAIN